MNEEKMKRLVNNEDFKCFLDMVHARREDLVKNLSGSPSTTILHEKTGGIDAYQAILDMADYGSLLRRF
jgi:hypothetical protein